MRTSTRHVPGRDGAPPVEVVVYEPADRDDLTGGVIWIHGGGIVMGHQRPSQDSASRLARDLGVVVVGVDYRLAPEHPFPAALHDCAAALDWLAGHGAAELGVDADRIAVGGESAGGLLAASLCQLAHDEGGPAIAFQPLNYPMLDDRTVLRADDEGRGVFVWTPASNRFGWAAYLGHPRRPETHRSTPRRPARPTSRACRRRGSAWATSTSSTRRTSTTPNASRRQACRASSTSSPACTTAPMRCGGPARRFEHFARA